MFLNFLIWLGGFSQISSDTCIYTSYADTILNDSSWLHHTDIRHFDPTSFRMPGFPLLIALSKYLFGEAGWQGGVFLTNLIFLGLSAYAIHCLAKKLHFRLWVRWSFLGCYLTGLPLYYSYLILTDSVFASLSVIAISLLGITYLRGCLSIAQGAVLFLSLVVLGFWRESGIPLILSCAPIWGVFFLQKRWKQGVLVSAVCLSALIFSYETMCRWNEHRSGTKFLTTASVSTFQSPLIMLSDRVPGVWDKTCLSGYCDGCPPYSESAWWPQAIQKKADTERISWVAIGAHLHRDYVNSWITFPAERFKLHFINKQSLGGLTYTTLWPPCGLTTLAFAPKDYPNLLPKQTHPRWFIVSSIITSILLSFLMLTHLGATISRWWWCWRKKKMTCLREHAEQPSLLYGALFLQSSVFVLPYLLFHIEYRYILSSLAFLGFLGWWALDEILDRRKEENVRIFPRNSHKKVA